MLSAPPMPNQAHGGISSFIAFLSLFHFCLQVNVCSLLKCMYLPYSLPRDLCRHHCPSKTLLGPMLWHRKYSCYIQYQHPLWVLICVPAALLLIPFLAGANGKSNITDQVPGPCQICERTKRTDWLCFHLAQHWL